MAIGGDSIQPLQFVSSTCSLICLANLDSSGGSGDYIGAYLPRAMSFDFLLPSLLFFLCSLFYFRFLLVRLAGPATLNPIVYIFPDWSSVASIIVSFPFHPRETLLIKVSLHHLCSCLSLIPVLSTLFLSSTYFNLDLHNV